MNNLRYKIYNIKAVAIDTDGPIADVPCGSCYDCCSKLSPFLTQEEFESGQYVYTFMNTPDNIPAIAIPRKQDGGCFYLESGKCTIYEKRPKACRIFDCRLGHHPKVSNKFEVKNEN